MDFNFGTARPLATQTVVQFNRMALPSTEPAIQLSEDLEASRLITSFVITNFSTNADSVFLSASQTFPAAIEIPPGASPVFTTWQEGRQMYELQVLIMKIASQRATDLIAIPIIVWDMRQWWLQAGGMTPIEVTVTAFPLPYL